jgi:hypothetical protein
MNEPTLQNSRMIVLPAQGSISMGGGADHLKIGTAILTLSNCGMRRMREAADGGASSFNGLSLVRVYGAIRRDMSISSRAMLLSSS